MSDGDCTRCGHGMYDHRKPTKREPWSCEVVTWDEPWTDYAAPPPVVHRCECSGYTVAVLPEGERLEFGKHRMEQDEAETAPAWPPLS